MRIPLLTKNKFPSETALLVQGQSVLVRVRHNKQAKNYRLALSPKLGPVLTIPKLGTWKQAQQFLDRHLSWLEQHYLSKPQAPEILPNGEIPIRGINHRIIVSDALRGEIKCDATQSPPTIIVTGGQDFFKRRLVDWLKKQARHDLTQFSAQHAAALGVKVISIKLGDQSTRWGSCSSTGNLNYNWRLIMAPTEVLDYVAAHEVAHLKQMNHSLEFWAEVERAKPNYKSAQAWLKANGSTLMAIQ